MTESLQFDSLVPRYSAYGSCLEYTHLLSVELITFIQYCSIANVVESHVDKHRKIYMHVYMYTIYTYMASIKVGSIFYETNYTCAHVNYAAI